MPLSAANFVPNTGVVRAQDMLNFFNLFTGVMTDQGVTFGNDLTVQGDTFQGGTLYFSTDGVGDIGAHGGNRPNRVYAASAINTPEIDTPGSTLDVYVGSGNEYLYVNDASSVMWLGVDSGTTLHLQGNQVLLTADPTAPLGAATKNYVDFKFSSFVVGFPLRGPADSATNPNYSFAASGNSGLYQPTSSQVGLSVVGNPILRASATSVGINVAPGTNTLDVTGTFHATGNTQIGGTFLASGAATFGSTVALSADPTTALQAATKQYVDAIHGVPAGGTTGQSLTKSSNADYALTWTTVSGGGGAPTYPLLGPADTAGAPDFSFTASPTSGLYSPTTNQSGLAAGGAGVVRVSSTGVGILQAPSGNALGVSGSGNVTGNWTVNGSAAVGAVIDSSASLVVSGTNTGVTQYGIRDTPTFASGVTTAGNGLAIAITINNTAFTMVALNGILVSAPTYNTLPTVTTATGLNVLNMGSARATNAYGIQIAAQSGSPTTNVGLLNNGTTTLVGQVTVNNGIILTGGTFSIPSDQPIIWNNDNAHAISDHPSTNIMEFHEWLADFRFYRNDSNNYIHFLGTGSGADFMLEAPAGMLALRATATSGTSNAGAAILTGGYFGAVASNAYSDGTNWQRITTANPSGVLQAYNGGFQWYTAAAGSGAISWTGIMGLDTSGTLSLTGAGYLKFTGSNQSIVFGDGAHYLQYSPAGATNLLSWTHDLQASRLGLGAGPNANQGILITQGLTGSNSCDIWMQSTLTATAISNYLFGMRIINTWSNGGFTGVTFAGIWLDAITGNSGSGSNSFQLHLDTPTGAANNKVLDTASGAYLSTAGAWTNAPSWLSLKDKVRNVSKTQLADWADWLRDGYRPVSYRYAAGDHLYTDKRDYDHFGFLLDDVPEDIRQVVCTNADGAISTKDTDGFLLAMLQQALKRISVLEKQLA